MRKKKRKSAPHPTKTKNLVVEKAYQIICKKL